MKANYFIGNGSFELREVEMPHADPGEVVIKNMVCGVCGTAGHIKTGEPGAG